MLRFQRSCLYFAALLLAGCEQGVDFQDASYSPSAMTAAAMKKFDANSSGTLEPGELELAPGVRAALATTDTNSDKAISADELKTRIASYVANNLVCPLQLKISYRGYMLADAQVKLVPEPFLVPSLPIATAVTGPDGVCMPRSEGLPVAAVYQGMYRIEISRPGAGGSESMPAKFNSATTLGVEAALDVPGLERGIVLQLKD